MMYWNLVGVGKSRGNGSSCRCWNILKHTSTLGKRMFGITEVYATVVIKILSYLVGRHTLNDGVGARVTASSVSHDVIAIPTGAKYHWRSRVPGPIRSKCR